MKDYEGVEDTLFIPLAGRVFASKKFKEFFYDAKALELERYIPNSEISENTGEYFTIAAVARFYEFDNLVINFIKKHGECNILCMGCGFETMRFRVADDRATFYEIDMPDVIKQRKIVLGESRNEILIGSNILDFEWIDQIDKSKPTLAIASGLFQYLHEEDVKNIIKAMKEKLNNLELAFDVTNKTGIKKAQEYVHKTGNEEAMMYFYLQDVDKFVKETNTQLIQIVPFYKNCTKILKHKLKFSTKFLCFFGDKLKFTRIIYLKVN